MRFYNRETELERLAALTQRAHRFAQFTTLTGRRRVGKAELARQHLQGVDRSLYFFVDRRPSPALLNEFSATLRLLIPRASAFSDWQDFFVFLFAEAERKPWVVVFDEFQNFLSVDESVYSILQGVWDGWSKRCGIHA